MELERVCFKYERDPENYTVVSNNLYQETLHKFSETAAEIHRLKRQIKDAYKALFEINEITLEANEDTAFQKIGEIFLISDNFIQKEDE